jgi:hypothetical protein
MKFGVGTYHKHFYILCVKYSLKANNYKHDGKILRLYLTNLMYKAFKIKCQQ